MANDLCLEKLCKTLKAILNDWPIVKFSLDQQTSGNSTNDKIDKFIADMIKIASSKKKLYPDDLITKIEDYFDKELNVLIEDDSTESISKLICQCNQYYNNQQLNQLDDLLALKPLTSSNISAAPDMNCSSSNSSEECDSDENME